MRDYLPIRVWRYSQWLLEFVNNPELRHNEDFDAYMDDIRGDTLDKLIKVAPYSKLEAYKGNK